MAVVVAQLVERSLPIPEVRGSNPVIGKIYLYWTFVYCQLCIEKTKIKKKEAGFGIGYKLTSVLKLPFWAVFELGRTYLTEILLNYFTRSTNQYPNLVFIPLHSHHSGSVWSHQCSGPSPQPTACRPPSYNLSAVTGSNQAQGKV